MQQYGPIILTVITFILALILCVQNTQAVAFQAFSLQSDVSLAILIGSSFILGFIPAIGFRLVRQQKGSVSKAKEIEWEKQDEKLAKEIGSDHVKQLEAKIETLEAALSAALKKKK